MFTLSHRTPLPASMIATFLLLTIIADLQLAHKGTTYWPKYTIKCVGVSIRLPYATETTSEMQNASWGASVASDSCGDINKAYYQHPADFVNPVPQ